MAKNDEVERDKARKLFLARVLEVAQSASGAAFILDILDFCDLFSASLKNKEDLEFYTGRRSVGSYIKNILDEVDERIYTKLLLKSAEEKRNVR
jgi:hypothetical protein